MKDEDVSLEIDSIKTIDHLGIVAGTFHKLGLAPIIDRAIPKIGQHQISSSQILLALILNGLGFTERRLYLFPEYCKHLDLERLIGPDISAKNLNESVIGRLLDKIYAYGPSKLFTDLVTQMFTVYKDGVQLCHVDTTNFSVHGEYGNESGDGCIKITKGHPKDKRWDLNRFALSMVVNQHGIPIFARAHDGNESDKEVLVQTILSLQDSFTFDPDVIFMGDSALYTDKNIKTLGPETRWISNVPATINEMTELLKSDLLFTPTSDPRYSCSSVDSHYGGVPQKWIVVSSEEMKARELKTFEKNLPVRFKAALKGLKQISKVCYACETDASNALLRYLNETPLVKLVDSRIKVSYKRENGKKGRPKAGETLIPQYSIDARVELAQDFVESEKQYLGRFILATNVLSLDSETVLNHYKGQMLVEKGFRFLKDKSFRVAEVYLKSEKRIEALCMVMVLCLMVYSYTEMLLRKRLKEEDETVLNQKKKPTSRPTLKWIFFKFREIKSCIISVDDALHSSIQNLDRELLKILRLLGPEYEKFYS
ncbi:transposase, IS4 family [Methanospirillum hungatei JF-1]|uniref:Transposase, IS4 family n=1 Tax=Methanospirillum hungatei JF-1 (strain ATCC 27890 / DSM 864 / NBRC 100397 / JF-1) TaxID=323259 RepID=Q2FM27_METHJ|nr:IS1634-like element ISMhu5 family transposase [Methanospirillum hungatei]ABD40936.1 transposase, IS4 family [Methanospirillum hungatei JF-1]